MATETMDMQNVDIENQEPHVETEEERILREMDEATERQRAITARAAAVSASLKDTFKGVNQTNANLRDYQERMDAAMEKLQKAAVNCATHVMM